MQKGLFMYDTLCDSQLLLQTAPRYRHSDPAKFSESGSSESLAAPLLYIEMLQIKNG